MTNYALLEEDELLRWMQKEDEAAFKEVYHRYWEKLVATGFYYTKSKESAEEIVNDVLLTLWHRRATVQIQSLSAYLGTAVKYAVFKAIGRDKRRREIRDGLRRGDEHNEMEEQLDALFLKDFLDGVVEKLPEKARLVFQYSREEQLSVAEIADKMDLSSKSVEYHMTKALKTIKEYIRKFNMFLS